jgi:mannose-6-phosphate isomerase class I
LRRSLAALAVRPFRTRPSFLPGPWGGQWLRRVLGVETDAPNLAWSYELITPESGLLLGDSEPAEVGFELLMAEHAQRVLGTEVAERFGQSFPIRFDYLDTLDGGHLSIQCHPSETYMRETFGLPYTQHETYYVMVTTPGAKIFLGLREDVDLLAFEADAELAEQPGEEFEPERYLQTQPAKQHRLYLIPAGTPHASGAGNVVLEISATPYIFTFKLWDWGRLDLHGKPRPIHLENGLANLRWERNAEWVGRNLVDRVRPVSQGEGWREESTGLHPFEFIETRRHWFTGPVTHHTGGTVNVLNLVEGPAAVVESPSADFEPLVVHYAETFVVPASVGGYRVRPLGGAQTPLATIKAYVRES